MTEDSAKINKYAELLMPKEVLVWLSSAAASQSMQLGASHDKTIPTLFLVHPADGTVRAYTKLIEKLHIENVNIYGLQCAPEVLGDSIESMAECYVDHVERTLHAGQCYIAGYCVGASIAIEMALQIQVKGRYIPKLILFDSTPEYTPRLFNMQFGVRKVALGQSTVDTECLSHFAIRANMFSDTQAIRKVLTAQNNLSDKLDKVAELLSNYFDDLPEHVGTECRRAAESWYVNHMNTYAYKPRSTLEGPVLLIKAEVCLRRHNLDETYGLQTVCKLPVKLCQVVGKHQSILEDPSAREVADHVRQFLNPEL